MRDQHTHHSKGYGFVAYRCRTEATGALNAMNGQRLGARAIRTNWATRRPPAVRAERPPPPPPPALDFDTVYAQTGPTNSTIYCAAAAAAPGAALSDRLVHEHFGRYGRIEEVRLFAAKGYAFVRFATKQAAAQAIVDEAATAVPAMRCAWSRDTAGEVGGRQPAATVHGWFGASGHGRPGGEPELQIPFVSGNDVDY